MLANLRKHWKVTKCLGLCNHIGDLGDPEGFAGPWLHPVPIIGGHLGVNQLVKKWCLSLSILPLSLLFCLFLFLELCLSVNESLKRKKATRGRFYLSQRQREFNFFQSMCVLSIKILIFFKVKLHCLMRC